VALESLEFVSLVVPVSLLVSLIVSPLRRLNRLILLLLKPDGRINEANWSEDDQ